MPNTRKITLEESREMSLKLEELLLEEAKIENRRQVLNRENKVALDRCIELQNEVRSIIKTGEIAEEEDGGKAPAIFSDEEGLNLTCTLTFFSMRSGLIYSEIQLHDVLSLTITEDLKNAIRAKCNAAIYDARRESLGYKSTSKEAVVRLGERLVADLEAAAEPIGAVDPFTPLPDLPDGYLVLHAFKPEVVLADAEPDPIDAVETLTADEIDAFLRDYEAPNPETDEIDETIQEAGL